MHSGLEAEAIKSESGYSSHAQVRFSSTNEASAFILSGFAANWMSTNFQPICVVFLKL